MGKVVTEAQEKSGDLNRYLIDLFKNHKIIKIFQRENFEKIRSEKFVNDLKNKTLKISAVYIRSTPVMEFLTGIMIAILIFYSGKLIMNDQLGINNFFSFLAAMMLAYQPVKSLTKVNIMFSQGLSAAKRILPIIDTKNEIFSLEKIIHLKAENPDAQIIAHPECEAELLEHAAFIGSTAALLRYSKESSCSTFIVATESGILHQMQKEAPEKTFIPAPPNNTCACNDCPHMRLNTLEKLYNCLKYELPEMILPEELIGAAKQPIVKMLEISERLGL